MNLEKKLHVLFNDLRRSLSLLWNVERRANIVILILQLLKAFLPIAALYCMKGIIDAVTRTNGTFDWVLLFILSYAGIQLLIVLANQYAVYADIKFQYKITDHLSSMILQKAIEVDYEYYENPLYYDTLHLAQQQASHKIPLLLKDLNNMIMNALSLIFLISFFFTIHALFGLSFIVVFIPLAIIKWYSGYKLLQLDKKFVPLEREASYINTTLTRANQAKEVRTLNYGLDFIKRFVRIRALIQKEKTALHGRLTWYSLLAEAAEVVAISIIFILLAKYTWEKLITIAMFVIYLQGFQRLQSSARGFLQALVQLFQQRLFIKDLFDFLDLKTSAAESGASAFPSGAVNICVKNVSFTYPDTTKCVLEDISIYCPPGKIIALVGENGSGKTTLIKLLARLYEVKKGGITINMTDIADISIPQFRTNTAFLFQDFEKYFLSIEENITMGTEITSETESAVEHAARQAQAHSFIEKLSNGYKTRIGRYFKDSEQLSGGQWQKIALSRIFYRNSRLIILDEPTSSLDSNSEFKVFENLKNNLKDQAIILVTHRLYNLKIADYIYVLKDGKIIQQGKFEDLTKTDGEFRTMYNQQKF